jgi:hypothetical protein
MNSTTINTLGRYIAVGGMLVFTLVGKAPAMQSCDGTYSAMSLRPLPGHIVVGLDVLNPTAENRKLAERFLAGIRKAGIEVGPRPTVMLHVTRTGLEALWNRPNGPSADEYRGAGSNQLSQLSGTPEIPDARFGTPRPTTSPPQLSLRVDATETSASKISWTATIQCRMIGTDGGGRAEALGVVVGEALGRRIALRPI